MEDFVRARAAWGRDLAARRAERFGRPMGGAAVDHEAMLAEFPNDPPAPPVALHLIYRDAKDHYSGRVVTLRTARREAGEIRLGAYCQLRGRPRAFLASRVVEVTDLTSGDLDEDGLAYFATHPLLAHSPEALDRLPPEPLAVQACRDEIVLLSFVAAADPGPEEEERAAIVEHVLRRWPKPGLREAEVRRRVRAFAPDERAFEQALGRMCAGAGDAAALIDSLRRVIEADGRRDPEELAFAAAIETRLRQAGRL